MLAAAAVPLVGSGSALADPYEPNDRRSAATRLSGVGSLSATSGRASATNDDWYRVPAGRGRFEVTLRSRAAEGELNLQVFDAAGRLLRGAYRSEDTSTIRLDRPTAGDVYLFVYGRGGYRGNRYDLDWRGTGAGPAAPSFVPAPGPAPAVRPGADAYEPNDVRERAAVLTGPRGRLRDRGGRATATNADWYRIDADAGGVVLELEQAAGAGAVSLQVFDAGGRLRAGSYGPRARHRVTVPTPAAGPLYVLAYARSYRDVAYDLSWSGGSDAAATPSPAPAPAANPAPAPAPPRVEALPAAGPVAFTPAPGREVLRPGSFAGRTVVIDLFGLGGRVTGNDRDGGWALTTGNPQERTTRDYDLVRDDAAGVVWLRTGDFADRGFTRPELRERERPRVVPTYWVGAENPAGRLDLFSSRSVVALGRAVRGLGARRVVLRGRSAGGGGAILAALEAPGVFDALVADVPWTAATRDRDEGADYHTRLRLTNMLFRRDPGEGPRTTDGRRAWDVLDFARRVRDGADLPPLLMVSGRRDTAMVWRNDRRLIEALAGRGRTFFAFWNQGGHGDALRRVSDWDQVQRAFIAGQYTQLTDRPNQTNLDADAGVRFNVRAADR